MPSNIRKSKKSQSGTNGDANRYKPISNDILIPIIGLTGAGKSNFINKAVGEDVVGVGHNLDSFTKEISCIPCPCPCPDNSTRRVVFVDTPGFDGSSGDEERTLQLIADWLAAAYNQKKKIAGIIYLHEISLIRYTYSKTVLDIINGLCGESALKNVILATTKWNDVRVESVGHQREKQLETRWMHMLSKGSRMTRFSDTKESAMDIVTLILQNHLIGNLQIQQEMGRDRMCFSETGAVKTLRKQESRRTTFWRRVRQWWPSIFN